VEPTPLEPAPDGLSDRDGLWLKREDLHQVGSFKWRGALPVLQEYAEAGAGAVVTASTGNHGAATAWAGRRAGVRAIVFVPEASSPPKLAMLRELGAQVEEVGADLDESKETARDWAAEHGLPFFEDGAEPAQYGGYAEIGREIAEALSERPARVLVAVGNGALLVGIARSLPDGAVGVVAKNAPVMARSVEAGEALTHPSSDTFADGMAVRVAVPRAVSELVERRVPMVEVSEREIAAGVGRFAAAGIRVEGSPGAALAADALLEPVDGATVVIVCGRNIEADLHRRAVEAPETFGD
jgi:threonine dehydratase